MTNELKYEALRDAIAVYKKICIDEIKKSEGKDYNAEIAFAKGELCAYKILENFIKNMEEE